MVVAAATAMGFRPGRRFVAVELPLAVPVLVAGLRVATVSNISLVSVGALIGVGGLGELFTDGFQRNFPTEILTGIVLTVLLALAADALLLGIGRLVTPWERTGSEGRRDEPVSPSSAGSPTPRTGRAPAAIPVRLAEHLLLQRAGAAGRAGHRAPARAWSSGTPAAAAS